MRTPCDKGSRWIGYFFSQQDVGRTISLDGSAKILVDDALCTEVEQSLGHQVKSASRTSVVLYAFGSTRQKLKMERVLCKLLLQLGFTPTCRALEVKICRSASDG